MAESLSRRSLTTMNKTPNTKDQTPEKLQTPNTNGNEHALGFGAWCFSGVWCLVFGVCYLLGVCVSLAQAPPVRNFKVATWFEPPHEQQMHTLLTGAEAQPLPGDRSLIKKPEFTEYLENGQVQITIETPQCIYDRLRASASSPEHLLVRAAEGRFLIEGDGFLWLQTNANLIISNRVHTFVQQQLLDPASGHLDLGAAGGNSGQGSHPTESDKWQNGIIIHSDWFEYSSATGLGIYHGNVRVVGTNFTTKGGRLILNVPGGSSEPGSSGLGSMTNRFKLLSLTMEDNVTVDCDSAFAQQQTHVAAQKAVYLTDTGVLQLSGHPYWRDGLREGLGDEIILDRTNKIYIAKGHTWLRMPVQTNSGSALLGGGMAQKPIKAGTGSVGARSRSRATNDFLEIRCDNYELHTNLAVFRKKVRAIQLSNGQTNGTINCGQMTVTIAGSNQIQRVLAQEDVVIAQPGDRHFSAGTAVYTATNNLLELSGNPQWRDGLRNGRGDLILVDGNRQSMAVLSNALMSLPANEFGLQSLGAAGDLSRSKTTTNLLVSTHPSAVKSSSPAARPGSEKMAEISCDRYILQLTNALFTGGVHLRHPRMDLNCEEVLADLPPAGQKIPQVVASTNVIADFVDEQGQHLHGKGDRAVYTYKVSGAITNQLLTLFGNPASLESPESAKGQGVILNSEITVDLVTELVHVRGTNYVIRGTAPAVDTNAARLPKDLFKNLTPK
ncbi:MAG: hypothetical protein C5B50_15700 [Verrucomicrobia bacterium]|nr:MAG: hypothetical protein C5B50_15700 [Verrucomicrobiota bacterium]